MPEEVQFQTKPAMALDQIRAAVAAKVAPGVVLADAAYGISTEFREGLTGLGLQYAVAVQISMTVWSRANNICQPSHQEQPDGLRGSCSGPRTTNPSQ